MGKVAVPTAGAAIGSMFGGPAGGVAGAVVGQQLSDEYLGKGVGKKKKRAGRMEKGSPEAVAWGKRMKAARDAAKK